MHLLHTKAPENYEGGVCLLARWIRRLIHFLKKQDCRGFAFGSCCRRLSGVLRSCLAVLLPYMPNGEELVMQLVKESSTNYCCPEVTVLPLEGDPRYPQDVTLVALSAAQNTVEHDRLQFTLYFTPKR